MKNWIKFLALSFAIIVASLYFGPMVHAQMATTTIYMNCVNYSCAPDIGAGINAAIAALPSCGSHSHCGTVEIPAGAYNQATTVSYNPWVALDFGPGGSITYSGTSFGYVCSDVPTSYTGNGGIHGLNLSVTNYAGSGIEINECTWHELYDVQVAGPGSSSTGYGILFVNTQKWTEQSNLNLVHAQNFVNGITFQDNCAGNTGCPSFSYARWRHVVVSPAGSRGTGFSLQNDADFSGSDLDLQCFGNGIAAITCLSLTGTSNMEFNRLKISGESPGSVSNVGISVGASANFSPAGLWEHWNAGTWSDSISGTNIQYIWTVPGFAFLQGFPNGLAIGASGNSYTDTLDVHNITKFRTLTAPDASGTIGLSAAPTSFTTTTATSDNVSLRGMTVSGHCALTPTNASAATNVATTYVSAKATNQITVTHAAKSGMTYDVVCTPN